MSFIRSGPDSFNSTVSNSSQERKDPESESEGNNNTILQIVKSIVKSNQTSLIEFVFLF